MTLAQNDEVEFVWTVSATEIGYGSLQLVDIENNRMLNLREFFVPFTFGLSINQVGNVTKALGAIRQDRESAVLSYKKYSEQNSKCQTATQHSMNL